MLKNHREIMVRRAVAQRIITKTQHHKAMKHKSCPNSSSTAADRETATIAAIAALAAVAFTTSTATNIDDPVPMDPESLILERIVQLQYEKERLLSIMQRHQQLA